MAIQDTLKTQIQRAEKQVSEARDAVEFARTYAARDGTITPAEQAGIDAQEQKLMDVEAKLAALRSAYESVYGAI